ncbi:hypothetical protein DSM104635_00172 [Terricaulis silvestris]|uniref:Uncharacterized protein n=1 Tax=Terricaulis silvestris TaxID=2686094 RepID=A0A6I6MP80_9CAUL|nr:hypothetical protein DSM104635_00172 [Terricaulis silvestris]
MTFAPSALGNPERDAIALLAHYDASPPRRTVTMRLTSDGATDQVFTDFTATQRRASHLETGRLRRLQIARPSRPQRDAQGLRASG